MSSIEPRLEVDPVAFRSIRGYCKVLGEEVQMAVFWPFEAQNVSANLHTPIPPRSSRRDLSDGASVSIWGVLLQFAGIKTNIFLIKQCFL